MKGRPGKIWLMVSLSLTMLSSAWMSTEKCCVPRYAHGRINEVMIIAALELTPDSESWDRYLQDMSCVDDQTAGRETRDSKIQCLRTQIERDLAFIISYTLLFVFMVWIIFGSGWKRMMGWILAGLIAAFDLLENLFIHYILRGFENTPTDIETLSNHIARMFDVSLSKWTLLLLLVLWMFHAIVRWKGWWFTAGKLGLLGSILLFLIMPVWDLEQSVQVPSVVLAIYLVLLVIVLVSVLTRGYMVNPSRQ